MSELYGTQYEQSSSPGQQLIWLLNQKFDEFSGFPPASPLDREYEQSVLLLPTSTFDECPAPRVVQATRPIPGQEQLAAERWQAFTGTRLDIHEAQGRVHTTYLVSGDNVLKRQLVNDRYGRRPDTIQGHLRQVNKSLGESLLLASLDDETRAAIVRLRTMGNPIEADEAQRLLNWVAGMRTEAPQD